MKKTGFGKRLTALLLAMTIFVSLVPAISNSAFAAQGDVVAGSTGLTGDIDAQDTISWPIKIYDYLNDGMLFEYCSAGDAYSGLDSGNIYGGYSYGGGQPMPIYRMAIVGGWTWNVHGIDYTSAAGYFDADGTAHDAFQYWGSTSFYANSYDGSVEKATEVTRSIVQPTYDQTTGKGTPMFLRGTYNNNDTSDGNTKSYGWISNFAKDDTKYYSKDEMRYAVMVYRTNEAHAGRTLRMYWAVSNSGYSSSADISNLNSGFGWNNDGLLIAEEVPIYNSGNEWTYVVVDMKSDYNTSQGIASNWDKIGDEQIAGVGMCWPLNADGEVVDISHIAYFSDEQAANNFGMNCVAFDNDPGEYLGYKVTMTHSNAGGTVVNNGAAPTLQGGDLNFLTNNTLASTAKTNWAYTGYQGGGYYGGMKVTSKSEYFDYVNLASTDSGDDTNWIICNTSGGPYYNSGGASSYTYEGRYITIVCRAHGFTEMDLGFWLEDSAGSSYYTGRGQEIRVDLGDVGSDKWYAFTYDTRWLNTKFGWTITGYTTTYNSVGVQWPGFNTSESIDIAYIAFHAADDNGTSNDAQTFRETATAYLNSFSYGSGTNVVTTVTRGSVVGGEMWNMGNNRAFTFLYANNGQGYPSYYTNSGSWVSNGGPNSNSNGYYSYQIGLNQFNQSETSTYNGTTYKTAMYYRNHAAEYNKDYVVDDSIIFLSSYEGQDMPYDTSDLDLGYTLHNSFSEGVMTAGLLQSSLATHMGMDGETYKVMNYKSSTVAYLATMLRDTLKIPERDYWGYNYNFIQGSESMEYAEDYDGDGVLDTLGRTWNGSNWVDASGIALSDDCKSILQSGAIRWDVSAGVWVSATGGALSDAQRQALCEDLDGDGHLDTVNEDKNNNGELDKGEDLNNDGNLDVFEDLDFDGAIDPDEDLDQDKHLDVFEDQDGDNVLDPNEDKDGDGKLDAPGWSWNGTTWVDAKGTAITADQLAKVKAGIRWDSSKNAWVNTAGETLDAATYIALTEDANGNGRLDKSEDLDNDGRLDGVTATWNGSYWVADNGMTSQTEEGRAYLLTLTEDADKDGALDPGEDLDGDGRLDKGNEDVDGDGRLDVFEDVNYNGKMDKNDLATALRQDLGVSFADVGLDSDNGTYQGTYTAELGSYAETLKKTKLVGKDGKTYNGLIGPYLKCRDNIETFYDAAYYLLHNLFVDNSYNQRETDYNYLVMSKGTVKGGAADGSDKEAYIFDGGFCYSDTTSAIKYDLENGTISMDSAAGKAMIYYTAYATTTAHPFLPVNDADEKAARLTDPFHQWPEEYYPTGSPYFREDMAGAYDIDYGGKYDGNNYNYVMSANGEMVFHYDDDLFFDFEGDDDVYLFVNGELVLDIGAAHSITKVKMRMNDYVDEARAVLNGIEGYTPEMDDALLEDLLDSIGSRTVNGKTYTKDDMLRLHKLNLVDGHSYDVDFYYMERHGYGANMRIATNIVMTDPTLATDKNAYQGTDVNGEPIEVEYGSLIDDSRPLNYEFAITNTGNTKLYKLSFGDPSIGIDLNYYDGLVAFGTPSDTQFEIEADTNLTIRGYSGSFNLDGERYLVSADGTITPYGTNTVLNSIELTYDALNKANNVHTLQLYQTSVNNTAVFQDAEAWVGLGGSNEVSITPNDTTGVYHLQVGKTNRLPVAGIRVTDSKGEVLDAADLTITVSGYASYEDYLADKPITPISITVRSNDELKKFLYNLVDPSHQTSEGEGIPDGKNSLYWGAGLWQNATVTISGMWYTLSEQQQNDKVFNNVVYTSGYKSVEDTVPLQGQANHRVYAPGEAMYYQWAGHSVALTPERLWTDVLKGCTDETNPLYEQHLGINLLNNAGWDTMVMQITDADGNTLTKNENKFSIGNNRWEVYAGTEKAGTDKRIIYFENSNNWSTINAYYWSDDNSSMVTWPGTAMTKAATGTNIYYIEIPSDAEKIIFNNVVDGSGYQTADLTLPEDSATSVTVDSANDLFNVNYTSTGLHMFYVKVTNTAVPDVRAMIPVSFHVTDVKDSTYVLDYGLRTEDLNTAGQFFSKDELLGSSYFSTAHLMGVTTVQPSYLGTYTADAAQLGNVNRIDFQAVTPTPGGTSDDSVYYGMSDGRYYLSKALDIDGAPISYSGSRYNLDRRMWFTPTDFMDQAYDIWMAISVHDSDAGEPSSSETVKYHAPGTVNVGSVTNEIDIGTEVQMYKKVTVLPATVVYYEDDFSGMKYDTTAGSFSHHGNGSGSLTQNVKGEQNYGSDPTYQDGANSAWSGNSMTAIEISNTEEVSAFTFTGTGFEIVSRTNSFDSAAFVVTVYDEDGKIVRRLPIVTEFTNDITKCTHSNHNTNGYCTYCGMFTNHTYDTVDGVCTSCGAEESVYYLTGWINGGDVFDDTYQFVDGKLDVQFASDSYVCVKAGSGDTGPQFWTNGYAGDVTSALLFEKNSITNAGGYADKLRIPGGVPVRLELVSNGQGGMVLSYHAKLSSSGERTLYYDNTNTQWERVNIYYWLPGEVLVDWPGVPMEPVEEGSNIYKYTVPSGATQVIFNSMDSRGFGYQTDDITIPGNGYIYTDGVWSVYGTDEAKDTYTVLFDRPGSYWDPVYVTYHIDTIQEVEDDPATEEVETDKVVTVTTTVQMTQLEGFTDRFTAEIPMDAYRVEFNDQSINRTNLLNVYGDKYRYDSLSYAWYNESGEKVSTKTVYYDNSATDWDQVYAYTWLVTSGGTIIDHDSSWPGKAMSQVPGTDYWKLEIPEDVNFIIFTNGSGTQTADLSLVGTKFTYTSTEGGYEWTDLDPENEDRTIYFENTEGWSSVDVNYWESTGSAATSIRVPMTNIGGDTWTAEIPVAAYGVMFSENGVSDTVVPTKTVYYDNTNTPGWLAVSVYYWGCENVPGWPGDRMVYLGNNIWAAEIPVDATTVIFNNGYSGDGNQTADLQLPESGNLYSSVTGDWTVYGDTEKTTQTVYYQNVNGWDNVYIQIGDAFPGVPMTYVSDDFWAAEIPVPASSTHVTFRSDSMTKELGLPADSSNYWVDGNWEFYVSGDDRELYQVPVIRVDDLEYGTYTVKISGMPVYEEDLDYIAIIDQANAIVAGTTTDVLTVPGDGYRYFNGKWSVSSVTLPAITGNRVFFENDQGWGNVYVNDGTSSVKMTQISAAIWMAEVSAGASNVTFSDHATSGVQALQGTGKLWSNGTWSDYEQTVEKDTYTLYFENTRGWSTVNYYFWGSAGENPGWPGIAMQDQGNNIWSCEIPKDASAVIFNNGNGGVGTNQTSDLSVRGDGFICSMDNESWRLYSGAYVVYFQNTQGWNEVYVNDGTNNIPMTNVEGDIWMATISASATSVEFTGVKTQTAQLSLPGDGYAYDLDAGEWSTFDQELYTVYYGDPNNWGKVYVNDGTVDIPMTLVPGTGNIWGAYILASSTQVSFNNGDVKSFTEEYDKLLAEHVVKTYLYIDGVRVFQPMGATNDKYSAAENGATYTELRDLILTQYAALATYDVSNSVYTGAGYTWTENRNGYHFDVVDETTTVYEGNKLNGIDDYLRVGPNNEVYMGGNLRKEAVVFYVKEVVGATDHTLQIAARALDMGLFTKGEASGVEASLYQGAQIAQPDGSRVYGWKSIAYILTGTEQYYTIDYSSCPYTVGEDGLKTYQVALYVRNGMASFSSVKYKGFTIPVASEGEATDLKYDASGVGLVEVATGNARSGALNYKAVSAQMDATTFINSDGSVESTAPETSAPVTPVTKPTVSLDHPSLSFEEKVRYNIYFNVSDMSHVAELGLITFDSKLTDGTIMDAVDVIPGAVSDGSLYMAQTGGIDAKRMGDALYFKVYARLTDGTYVYSDVAGYSALAYANTILTGSSNAEMKALVVAMLNYGAEAQKLFGHNTDSLMNAGLTAEQQALVGAYNDTMMDAPVAVTGDKAGAFVLNEAGFTELKPTVSFDGAFGINYYFTTAFAADNGMTMYYWTASDFAAADVLSADNATGTVAMLSTATDGQYWGQVGDIAAKEIDQTIYVAAVYEHDGVSYSTGVIAYHVGQYCKTVAAGTSATADLAAATAVYGYYAKEFFAN